jgi:hypothetical protein
VGKQFEKDVVQMGGGHAIAVQKQLFTNININLFVPLDPNIITANFNLNDMIDDNPELLERM